MDSEHSPGSTATVVVSSVIVVVLLLITASAAQAQPAPGIVVTSPHVWQPGGSEPPHGVQVLPGGRSHVELRFTNTGANEIASHRPRLTLRYFLLESRSQFTFMPAVDPRCGTWMLTPPQYVADWQGYELAVGPIRAGETLVCRWEVLRSTTAGDDMVLNVPGLAGSYVHFGTITDLETVMEQLTPMTAGVSWSALFQLTVRNPVAFDLTTTPHFGVCRMLQARPPSYRPDGPAPCALASVWCMTSNDPAITAGAVAAT